MKKTAIDVNDLEAQFSNKNVKTPPAKVPAFIIGDEDDDDDGSVVLDDRIVRPFSYASVSSNSGRNSNNSTMTVEQLEAQLLSGLVVGPKSPVSQLVGAGPPPGLSSTGNTTSKSATMTAAPSTIDSVRLAVPSTSVMSSTAPLLKNDPNHEFMNRFERNLMVKIHTTQLTTETPKMEDFYYQALTKKKATTPEAFGNLLYFPLPSAADRQKEFQRRERRRKQREREREKERERNGGEAQQPQTTEEPAINVDLVLGKVSHSSSRKPRQQLQMPTFSKEESTNNNNTTSSSRQQINSGSLHEQVLKGIEAVYAAVLSVEDFYLLQEEEESVNSRSKQLKENPPPSLESLAAAANSVIKAKLHLNQVETPNLSFIHFLTIPKGRAVISRTLQLLDEAGKEQFLAILVDHFDFLDVVRPETSLQVIDAFIGQVLSPLVAFVGEAEWPSVLGGLSGLFAKKSFVWLALTKAGMVLICILLSRLEILKAACTEDSTTSMDEAAVLTEKMFDALEGHLIEFFNDKDPSRDFYAWQCLALLAMNVESDRKRSMILELRDKILSVVELGEERPLKNLNVFLNALGLDASQLK